MGLVIAGERSGVGKTTVTLALLAALHDRAQTVQSFKVGPDYIDPMFHQVVTGRSCRNLDPVLTSETYVQQCFLRNIQRVDFALVEGVMGLFDGATGTEDWASTAHIARLLNLPVLLVVDCSRLSRSVAAIVHGYRSFDPRIQLAGVVLNRVGSDRHLQLLQEALSPLQIPILGVLRREDSLRIPDRHLGLIPTDELPEFPGLIPQLATLGHTCFDWSQLLPLISCAADRCPCPDLVLDVQVTQTPVRLAIARDRAFSFYYPDNLEILEAMGAELLPWSPLADQSLPENTQGLYLGGGFPEMFAEELAANVPARQAIRQAIDQGIPTYVECGGLMYLCQEIIDFDQQAWSMVGVLPTTAIMGARLHLGYRRAIALRDSPLLAIGMEVWGHEFHRSHLSVQADQPLFQLRGYDPSSSAILEGWQFQNLHASYLHLHFGARPELVKQFLRQCQASTLSNRTVVI